MPIIDGKKMACEPCIRGHRSTKCAHTDRTMVEVRKPGRPLSSCPHPSGRNCSCAGSLTATIAIPRRTPCGCSSGNGLSTRGPLIKSEAPQSEPPSPTGRHRIAKSSQRHFRKTSITPDLLSRVDPSSVNVLGPYNPFNTGINSNGVVAMVPPFPPNSQNGYELHAPAGTPPMGQFQLSDPLQPQPGAQLNGLMGAFQPLNTSVTPAMNGTMNSAGDVSPTFPVPNGVAAPSSCCSATTRTSGTSSVAHHTPSSSVGSGGHDASAATESKTTSCCASKAQSPTLSLLNGVRNVLPTAGSATALQALPVMSTFEDQTPQTQGPPAQNPAASDCPREATVYMLPPGYGSFQQPMNQAQWIEHIASMYAQPLSTPQGLAGVEGGLSPIALDSTAISLFADGVAHECRCGPSCNCIGCAVHPFNAATHDYIVSALKSQNTRTNLAPEVLNSTVGGQAAAPALSEDVFSATTPPDASAASPEEQVYNPNEYYFFQYQICEGQGESCPCGDDCRCIGCIIHGNASA